MNKIPTAEDLLDEITPIELDGVWLYSRKTILALMQLNAKLHKNAALEAAGLGMKKPKKMADITPLSLWSLELRLITE